MSRFVLAVCLLAGIGCADATRQPSASNDVDSTSPCVPNCQQQQCGGDNGCGGECPNVCDGTCDETGACDGTLTCIATCEGKVCGDGGCGTHCGLCADGLVCTTGGTCDLPEDVGGDTCLDPIEIDTFPYTVHGSTTGYGSDYGYAANTCPGVSGSRGTASADTVYTFTPETSGAFSFQLEAAYDANLYVVTHCNDIDGSCVAAHDEVGEGLTETVNASLSAGTLYFVIVDGWSNYSDVNGSYTLTVGEGCTPNCTDKLCGGDGCGGECPNYCGSQTCDFETGLCIGEVACPPPCLTTEICFNGYCCVPDCEGKDCGLDGCGGECPGECEGFCDQELGICEATTGVGACTNTYDETIVENGDVVLNAYLCFQKEGPNSDNITTCLIDESGISAACAYCFASLMTCMADHCFEACEMGHTPACEACVLPNCSADVEECSGLPFSPGP